MTKKAEAPAYGRRDFFRKASLGAGAAGVAAVSLAAKDGKAAVATDEQGRGVGYQETAHVKKFYELARF